MCAAISALMRPSEHASESEDALKPISFTVSLNLQIRALDASDFHKNFFPILEQLSNVGHISQDFFAKQLERLHKDRMKKMLVCEDASLGRIVATGTMVVEPKFIHSAGFAGHLEDLVVDHALRAKGVGRRLVEQLKAYAKAAGCYKVIVDCGEHNIGFYEKCGFKQKEMSMACYFQRDLPVNEEYIERRSSFSTSTQESADASDEEEQSLSQLQKLKEMKPRHVDGLIIRPLENSDYHRNYLQLLSQLTTVGDISEDAFHARVASMARDPLQHMIVIEEPNKGIVAAGTLLLERKFIHAGGLAGHVEDVVVDSTIRGKGLGKRIVDTLRDMAKEAGCYKVVLDCTRANQPFYEKCGFRPNHSPVCMACYF